MTFAGGCIYLLLIPLVGYPVLSLIHPAKRMGMIHWAALASALGAGTWGLLLFWSSLLGFAPSRALLAVISGLAFAGLAMLKKRGRLIEIQFLTTAPDPHSGRLVALLGVLGAGLGLMAVGSLLTPLHEWDALAVWGLKAKVLAHEALRPVPAYFHDLTLSYSHLNYPLLVPALTAGAYAAMGTVDDQTGKLVSVFLSLLVVPLVYTGLRWKLQRLPSLCLSAVFTLLPMMFRYAGEGCADLPLATFYAGSVIFVAKWIEEQQRHDLILATLFSAFAAFTKNEGLALALINGLVILGLGIWRHHRRPWICCLAFFAGFLALNAAWLVWRRGLPHLEDDHDSKLSLASVVANLPKWGEIIPVMALPVGEFRSWGLLWILLGAMTLLGWRALARPHVQAVWILLVLHLLSYALIYSVSPLDFLGLAAVSLDRLLLHVVPAVILLIGWHWASMAADGVGQLAARPTDN